MRAINKSKKKLGHIAAGVLRRLWFCFPNDRLFVSLIYWLESGKWADLRNPLLFTEKIQWLKLYDRREEYINMVDKISAKEYVANRIGREYVIPTLGVWNHFDEIDFSRLPNEFVLKTNHAGGGSSVIVCPDKQSLDRIKARKLLEKSLRRNGYWAYREWPYKMIKSKVFAEKMLQSSASASSDIIDYKFFCFGGVPKYCQVIMNRRTRETIDFFDMEWNHQEFVGLNPGIANSSVAPERPRHFEEMKVIAEKLSRNIPFVRIDLYDTDEHVYFGEITFYPASGLGEFNPPCYDLILGEMIQLPTFLDN
jgi:hypothetical protein